MKSSCKKEDTEETERTLKKEDRKKYVFFSDPDVIVQRAEKSAAAAQIKQDFEFQQHQDYIARQIFEDKLNPSTQFNLKVLENLLSYHPVQPYPFTFISAVKRKLALDDNSKVCKKVHDPNKKNVADPFVTVLKSNSSQNLHEIVQKMDLIRPLKVPDLKISAKKLDFATRENSTSRELTSPKFETPSKELIHERADKPTKSFERVQRRLDFSTSDVSSIVTSEIEPLKVPNISISSNLSKKKEYIRENSREKENRSKRVRKEESLFAKQDEVGQDFLKRSRSPRCVSRKDFPDNANETASSTKLKNDRLSFHISKDSDFVLVKPKSKNVATSSIKKDNDKRHRSTNPRSLKSRDASLESRNRTCSNESLSERSSKLPDKITVRESRNAFENFDHRYKDDLQIKQHKVTCQPQGKSSSVPFKEQTKRVSEKIKPSTSKTEGKTYVTNSKEFEDKESITDSNVSVRTRSPSTISNQQIKVKDLEKAIQNIHAIKSNKTTDDSKYTDSSLPQCTSTNTKKDEEESFTQSITTTAKQSSNSNSNESNLNDSALSDALFDPRRISFREESRQQPEEFCDLVTPEMNLLPRSKRKRQFIQNSNTDADSKCLKYNTIKTETDQEGIPLLHPTALHMQFQAELHLLDSFNESLRQVMDVEKCLYNVKQDQDKELPLQHSQSNDHGKSHFSKSSGERNADNMEQCSEISKLHKHVTTDKAHYPTSPTTVNEFDNLHKMNKPVVKAVEVQTQTVNDMATQTEIRSTRRNVQSRCSEICGVSYERGFAGDSEIPQLSLDSAEQFEDLDQIEEISLPSKLRTMSEISLHETTSSIRTETGTEISISTRDITCSFNKYIDLEIAQLIKDEKQRYDKFEMLFKSREKTLNDRTKKLVKLEERKRALKDTGQDSRVSSVKKKQRALLLKLQQEKDEMSRLKELHKIASQERKLMLQKQRNMFNPQMSTKNILTKLKRSADSQSPRRLSGPMKGYDIRSNSSMSSLVDSDKSQHDRSQTDGRMQMSENELRFSKLDLPKSSKFTDFVQEPDESFLRFDKSSEVVQSNTSQEKCPYKLQKDGNKSKYEIKSRKFEEKMPRADNLRLKSHQHSVDPKLISARSMSIPGKYYFEKEKSPDVSELLQQNLNNSISEHAKSESDTLVEELSKKSKPSHMSDNHFQSIVSPRERESLSKVTVANSETVPEEISSVSQDTVSKTSKSSQVSEDIIQTHSKSSKRSSKSIPTDMSKKTQYSTESKSNIKRKASKCQKSKSSSSILTENILRSKSNSQMSEEFIKHHNKRTRMEKEFIQSDKNDENGILDSMDHDESQSFLQTLTRHSKPTKDKNFKLFTDIIDDYESKENILCQKIFDKSVEAYESSFHSQDKSTHNLDNMSTKSQVSNFAVSHHSSGESDRNYSKSVVVRSQDHNLKTSKKLEQILNAREAALTSRKNCVEEWMAWHAKLRTEEDRVARMEQAALKLVTTTSNVFSQQERSVCPFIDTTVSSDTSDIEGRIELLTERLAERRLEMSRLKREARKQTKQKLRALETNLLNQIKKYDTTIHEMRRKLESKKGTNKDSDKLAIESKSLADFKVPEIPLKRIQDIFKNSDLLRSRSESDLLSTKRPTRDPMKTINLLRNENIGIKYDKNYSEKITPSSSRNVRTSEKLSSTRAGAIGRSIETILDECIPKQTESDKLGSISSVASDDVQSDKHITYRGKAYLDEMQNRQTVSDGKRSSITEDIETEISAAKSDEDIPTQSEIKLSKNDTTIQSDLREYKSDFDTASEQSRAKSISSQSDADKVQDSEYSRIPPEKSNADDSKAEIKTESADEMLGVSRKLDFLRLNNKTLYEDINSLENEFKILSEMMLRFSKKSSEESRNNEEKSTSKDISEILLKSDKNNEIHDMTFTIKNKDTELERKETDSDVLQYLKNSHFNDSKSVVEEVDNVMSVIMPQDDTSLSKSNQEIDYKARSKEILNVIEKSIISEHIKATENDSNRSNTLTENNKLIVHERSGKTSSDLSAETDIKSVSKIYSRTTQDKESINTEENASEVAYTPREDDIEKSIVDSHVLESNRNSITPSERIDDEHSSIINNAISTYSQSEHNSDVISQKLPQNVTKRTTAADCAIELSKKEVSPQSLSPIEKTVKIKEVINKHKTESDDNDVKITQDEVAELEETSSKSVESPFAKNDWTISDSFQAQQDVAIFELDKSQNPNLNLSNDDFSNFLDMKDISRSNDNSKFQNVEQNVSSDINDASFVPDYESTNIDIYGMKCDETVPDYHVELTNDKINYILGIATTDTNKEENEEETMHTIETDDFQKAIYDSVTKILDKVEKNIDNNSIKEKIESHSEIRENEMKPVVNEEETISLDNDKKVNKDITAAKDDTEPTIDVNLNVEIKDDDDDDDDETYHIETKSQEVIITELEPGSVEDDLLSELEIDAKVEFLEEEQPVETNKFEDIAETEAKITQDEAFLAPVIEQDSSDGEQLDNLIEIAESGLDIIEKQAFVAELELISDDKICISPTDTSDNKIEGADNVKTIRYTELTTPSTPKDTANKTFNILKDPEYEDISEESLEVSEIFDKSEVQKTLPIQKTSSIPERYEAVQKSDEVLRILDEITQKSLTSSNLVEEEFQSDKQISEKSGKPQAEISGKDDILLSKVDDKSMENVYHLESQTSKTVATEEANQSVQLIVALNDTEDKENQEQYASSESSGGRDTPKGVSEIEMDSPRDSNDSRLDIDVLNDDLLNNPNAENQNVDSKNTYHATPIVATSEKDIEVMIDKLKASLEQPGLEVAELEAKLLRIEQLQIELEIKKLEAEEVSYYVREIPNKPPPPYTPPGGGGRISVSLGSPSPPPAVIPSNIEELTAFTEKATTLIFRAREAGEDIMSLEAPPEICELTKENDETVKKDRRIYNTFLFDLCKETIAEVYQAEYEKPGPSWTKPNVKTKPTMKLPKTVEELNEYVNKEVATLFGFKTKLQRENMVMRWSRKRRDRVDELLAREAQAEEDEWTKFHNDELAVKNGLTVAILDTLLMETVNVVEVAYAKKRKVMI
ncbi:centrosome-associated protein 350-like isoform X1 [Hylaeus volcanicus]|uniref:centrosome-associated protein 350-like isoform X1 n=1 Tax=Hylaeus volcanicus TaxID=313075 RepID=UPI0023B7E28D|nr:centrosome-associated protein 350-like isoform X1 [Hylaeus volcanicus]XP_053984392.1 centrosome-associated protein 350-like isoform X1 [Hylaeus volcanicus]